MFAFPAFANPLDSIDAQSIATKLSLVNNGYYLTTEADTKVEQVVDLIKNNQGVKKLDRINFGYNDKIIWLVIPLKNARHLKENLFIEIKNPQIDLLQAYCVTNNSIKKLGNETGDYLAFDTRYILHRNFMWPVNACNLDNFSLILRVDKRKTSLDIPISLITESTQRTESTQTSMFYGICFGMMILVIIYSLGAGISFKARLYFIYAFLILNTILLLATAVGLSFQFLYPNWIDFNSSFRVVISLTTTVLFIIFSREFLNTKQHTPISDRILITIGIIFTVFLLSSIFVKEYLFSNSEIVLKVAFALTGVSNITCLVAALLSYPKQKSIATFYFVAYGVFILMAVITIIEDFGWIETITFNILFIGALAEIIVFSFGLTYRIKKIYDERNDLSLKISRHQKDMLHAYVQGIEKERERVAGELHDDIGSRLSNLRRILSQNNQGDPEYIENQLQILANDVRALSHQMSPTAIQFKGLTQVVTDLIADLQKGSNTKFSIQCYDVPESLSEQVTQQIYRVIQEAAQNILKHAQASEADIQVFGHENELVVTVEDNGRGFHQETSASGLGLSQIKARVESIGGNVEISSTPGYGTQLMVTVPLA